MKKAIIILAVFFSTFAKTADPADSATISKIISDGNAKIIAAIKGQTKEISDTLKAIVKPSKVDTQVMKESTFWSPLLCFLPVLFFFLLLISIAVKLKRDNI